jgi:hypothetical protein
MALFALRCFNGCYKSRNIGILTPRCAKKKSRFALKKSAEFFATFFDTTPRYAEHIGVDSALCCTAHSCEFAIICKNDLTLLFVTEVGLIDEKNRRSKIS